MRKGRADGRLPMLKVVVMQALFFHQFWRGYPLAEYRFIMPGMWVGLAGVPIFAARFAQELSDLDREQWRDRTHRRALVNDVQTKLDLGGRHGIQR
jgi:hypothetical protein